MNAETGQEQTSLASIPESGAGVLASPSRMEEGGGIRHSKRSTSRRRRVARKNLFVNTHKQDEECSTPDSEKELFDPIKVEDKDKEKSEDDTTTPSSGSKSASTTPGDAHKRRRQGRRDR